MSRIITIDLSKYKNDKAKFIVGRENGNKARQDEQLDKYLNQYLSGEDIKIEFTMSNEIYGVVSSFILGMLSEIVLKINNKKSVYNFLSFEKLDQEIQQEFEEEINYILGE